MTRVIVIEDDEDLGLLLLESLTDYGFDARLYNNASSGIAGFQAQPAEIIVTDIIITEGGRAIPDGGILAASRIKALAKEMSFDVRVIAISGSYNYPGLEKIMSVMKSVGADATLAKPFAPEDLLAQINELLDVM